MASTCRLALRQAISGVDSTHISIPFGIIIGLLASFVQSLGLTIQRKSHVLNQLLPERQQRVEHRRPLWLVGFAIFISSNVIGSLVQIASLPVVILAPLGAVSLLWNAFFARLILGDVFSPWMVLGTVLIAGGAVLIAVFGIVPEPTRSLEDLLALFSRPAFVIYFSILGATVLISLIITHLVEFSLSRRISQANSPLISSTSDTYSTHKLIPSSQPAAPLSTGLSTSIADAGISERTPLLKRPTGSPASSLYGKYSDADVKGIHRTRLLLAISYSSFSGIISGMCLLFAKSGVELLLLTLQGDNQFWRWQAWVLVLGLIVFALLQLWYLHKALVLADPTLVCPSAFCFYNVSSILNGLVYFNQFSLIPPFHLALVVLGMSVLLGGVWVVSIQSGAKEEDIETWGECDDLDIGTPCLPDVEETLLHTPQRIEIGSVAMERGTRSESDIHDLSGPNGPTLDSGSTTSPPFRTSPLRHLLSPERTPSTLTSRMRRRRTTYDAGTHTSTRRSPPLLPINTIGTGFQIGLSPVSPGFAIQPRERGRRVSGRGVSEILDGTVEEQLRRRTVSEGDVRKKALALVPGRAVDVENEGDDGNRGQVVTDRGKGKGRESKRRWDWLRRVLN